MTNIIKAIETTYKGFRFRSRLEARWAVFFDGIGAKWEFEREGVEVNGVKYLPDFYFPESCNYLETKHGETDFGDLAKPYEFARFGGAVIVLAGQPWPGDFMAWVWKSADSEESEKRGLGALEPWPTAAITVCSICQATSIHLTSRDGRRSFQHISLGSIGELECSRRGHKYDDARVHAAFAEARGARFEFGETPS
jgi:hypothetical protein